jgi:hypothetical protein
MRSVVIVRALVRDGRYLGLVVKRTPDIGVDDFVVSILQKAEEVGMVKVSWNAPDRPIVDGCHRRNSRLQQGSVLVVAETRIKGPLN